MSNIINVKKRDRAGKGAARQVRREKMAPGVVYGGKTEPTLISVDPRIIVKNLETGSFFNTVYELDIEGKKEKVLPRDIQFHVVKDTVQHVDFMRVDDKQEVKVLIPVEYTGMRNNEAIRMGGRLQIVRRDVEIISLAGKIPAKFTVDVSKIKFGQIVRFSNLDADEGIRPAISDRDFVLATMKAPRGASVDEELDETEAETAAAEETAEDKK